MRSSPSPCPDQDEHLDCTRHSKEHFRTALNGDLVLAESASQIGMDKDGLPAKSGLNPALLV